jgi:phospholipid/cholesterol/gamma-HCH transport system substrate-binding protein
MQTTGSQRRPSRSLRESLLGLFVLAALGLFGVLLLWARNFNFGSRSYSAIVEFQNASGMAAGTPVSYRGVKVGQVTGVQPEASAVALKLEIDSDTLLIPKKSLIEARQAGLIGETLIDITPQQALPENITAGPLDKNCDSTLIVCDGDRVIGEGKLDVDALIRSLLRISDAIGTPEFASNINRLTKNAADAASGVAVLTREVIPPIKSIGKTSDEFRNTAGKLNLAASEVQSLAGEIRREISPPLLAVKQTADEFRVTARQLNEFQVSNRESLSSTLRNVEATSTEIRQAITALRPLINDVAGANFIQNLDALIANATKTVTNLQTATQALSDPQTFLLLQQTLDSARLTFQNAEKITTDLDELVGNSEFREQIRRLIEGLSRLVSSTQQLEQQTQVAEALAPIAPQIRQAAQQPDSGAIPAPPSSPAD